MAMITAFSTVISMAAFIAICWWAWSSGRKAANQESAMLPFALPDEPLAARQEDRPDAGHRVARHAGGANNTTQEH
ncbi:cytochrome C oxidase Cbb3 [Cupriavidus basilensis]|uniref:Cytochrome C oxidase Cbb3 n=1 Tax=Cupriavidus basilensis TaxID=68895 RepID=A0A643FM25_9BURK|nr:cytochrome C oxidase Cbb3 [Cupriavidus basilensis]QOT74916.1 cytochrome C oxidase Cbb3 [Cupriavidus basilensis]